MHGGNASPATDWVGASIGVVEIEDSLVDAGAVMSAADTACYEAKRAI